MDDGRILITLLTNHISRLQELFTEVSKTHRKIVVMGKKMQNLVNYVIDEGYVTFDKENIGNLTNIDDKDTVILISNENQKPFVNLERIVELTTQMNCRLGEGNGECSFHSDVFVCR